MHHLRAGHVPLLINEIEEPLLALDAQPGHFGLDNMQTRARDIGAALTLVLAQVVVSVFATSIAPYDPVRVNPNDVLQGPGVAHWLGTDDIGRDLFSRIIYGARTSLTLGLAEALDLLKAWGTGHPGSVGTIHAGTALGAALYVARALGDAVEPFSSAALGREWDDEALADRVAGLLARRVSSSRSG